MTFLFLCRGFTFCMSVKRKRRGVRNKRVRRNGMSLNLIFHVFGSFAVVLGQWMFRVTVCFLLWLRVTY